MRGVLFPVFVLFLLSLTSALPALGAEPPSYLGPELHSRFEKFLELPKHRAFAISKTGAWGHAYGQSNPETARKRALSNCEALAPSCFIIAENEEIMSKEEYSALTRENSATDSPLGFTERFSQRQVALMAIVGLIILVLGALIAERYPFMLPMALIPFPWIPKMIRRRRMNYTCIPFMMGYLFCVSPIFYRIASDDLTSVLEVVAFFLPIIPVMVLPLYLNRKLALTDLKSK